MGTVNRTVFGCPSCGARVSGYELACPRCGVVFNGESKFECPFCASLVPRDSAKCPSCGIDLRLPEEKPVEATLDELFDEIIQSEKQKSHSGGKRFSCPGCSFLLTGEEERCPKCSHEFTKVNQVECPICGALIPSTSKKCPECDRALVSLDELAGLVSEAAEEIQEPGPTEVLFPELEEAKALPKPAEVKAEPEPPPPRDDQVLLPICPVCGHDAPADLTVCPHCKTEFEVSEGAHPEVSGQEPMHAADEAALALDALLQTTNGKGRLKQRKLKPEKTATTRASSVSERDAAGRLGKVNGTGFVNGRHTGRGSGVTNGTGLVNGSGAINGLGATNGVSLVNGLGVSNGLGVNGHRRSKSVSRRDLLTQWRVLAVLVALMMIVPAFFLLGSFKSPGGHQIDGNFDEWASVQSYPVQATSPSTSINVQGWSATFSGDELFYYVRTEASVMAGPAVESICMFVDSDGSSTTGYAVSTIGADHRVVIEGWNGTVRSSSIFNYDSRTDQYDWNSWAFAGASECFLAGAEVEGRAMLSDVTDPKPTVLLVSKDEAENLCFSAPVPVGGKLLIADQEPGPGISSSGVVNLGTDVQFLRIVLSAVGGSGTVSTATPAVSGCALASTFGATEVRPGAAVTYDFRVDTSAGTETQLVSAVLSEQGIVSDFDAVLVLGVGAKAYLVSPPSNVTIDGAFADWLGRTSPDSDLTPVQGASIDIVSTGASNTSEEAFFYVSVRGEMCCGAYVPSICAKPVSGGGGTYIPSRRTAEDVTRIFIDTDLSPATGQTMTYLSKAIGADAMIEIRGLFGRITSSTMYEHQGSGWVQSTTQVDAANDEKRLEIGIARSALGSPEAIDFIFETTSWNGRSDLAAFDPDAVSAYLMSGDFLGTRAWPVASPVTPSTATAMSYQRKLFYDGTNFWGFYFDGSNTLHKYSSDGGQTWTSRGQVFSTSGVRNASLWYDSANNIVYAVGDTSTASANIYLQRGTVSPGAATITWAGSDSTLAASSNSFGDKNTFLSKDSNGYVWVISSNYTITQPKKYDLSIFRSASVDSISSWLYSANMLTADSVSPTLKGSVLPAGSGSNVWAIYNYDRKVVSKSYTGSWSGEAVIFTGGGSSSGEYINIAPACAVVGPNGVVHVVHGDSHEDPSKNLKPYIQYSYNQGSGWSTSLRLDAVGDTNGNQYPTISLDSSTGNLYVFWVQMDNNNLICKRNSSGTWSFVDLGTQNSYAKSHLTSVYSAPGQSRICFMWTQNTTSPIEVMFDKIPEFSAVMIPAGFMMIAVILLSRRSTGRKDRRKPSS